MSLSTVTKAKIAKLLKKTVRDKLRTYQPETVHAPFHHRLLGKDRYAMFSFVHSMNTTFGISVWEQVAVVLIQGANDFADRQHKLLGEIDEETERLISHIHYKLRKGEIASNQKSEVEQIKKKIKKGQAKVDPDSVVDLFANIKGVENYFDITSAKPNMKEFVALKLKLLRWTALRLSQDISVRISTRLAIPYNPYHPEAYERWTLRGLYDLENREVLVGEDFWNFVASDNIYDELLDIFQEAGEELRIEIDRKFAELRR